ncbi:MAG: DUF2339 domain-containing protein [Methylobacillus sp.]|jgi:uncharacterized membrane protein|nr:DUF2339 domain-containing protein [Methylobacillus sp.]
MEEFILAVLLLVMVFGGIVLLIVLIVLWSRQNKIFRELEALKAQIKTLLAGAPPAPAQVKTPVATPVAEPVKPAAQPVATEAKPQTPAPAKPATLSSRESAIITPSPKATVTAPREPKKPNAIWRWFTEGNVPVKIGMVVLFAGVAALLKYMNIDVGVRVSLVAVAALAGLVFGWMQRDKKRVFALSLQGGAIGVLLITIFACFRILHDGNGVPLLPSQAAFVLLVVLVVCTGILAVVQNSKALAVLGLLAGFAAPILTSTDSGNHVALFSYYMVLNLAILGIGWKRSWRVLNLLGFIATFGVATAWGVLKYEPEFFASTEPFLVLNFLFYLIIPWLHARQAPEGRERVIDGILIFGNPLICLFLQAALLDWRDVLSAGSEAMDSVYYWGYGSMIDSFDMRMALSIMVAAVIYITLAFMLRRQQAPALRLLREIWCVLAVALATLAVPIALSAQMTSSIFALEGAGLIWLGLHQQRRLARWSGLFLQLFAVIAFRWSLYQLDDEAVFMVSRVALSAALLALAAFVSSGLYARRGNGKEHNALAFLLYLWGMVWWMAAGYFEIDRFVPALWEYAAWLGWFTLTAWGAAEAARRRFPGELGTALRWSPAAMFTLILFVLLWMWLDEQQPLRAWSLAAIAASAVLGWRVLICLRDFERAASVAHVLWLWRWILVAAIAIALALDRYLWLSYGWITPLAAVPLFLTFALAQWRPKLIAPPMTPWISRWQPILRTTLLIALGLLGFWGIFKPGGSMPLPYLPLLNPFEIMLMLVGLCVGVALADNSSSATLRRLSAPLLGIFVLAFATSATLRGVHHLGGVWWSPGAMGGSDVAQMSLTVVWSALGLLAWIYGSRRGVRSIWLAGAIIMGVVLLKLIVVDRQHLGNLFGIGSFIVYGLLCIVVGFLAPAPPRRSSSGDDSSKTKETENAATQN